MIKVLFINSKKAQCSIWESGYMAYSALQKYSSYSISYMEISEDSMVLPANFDIYLFNYQNNTMKWLDLTSIVKIPKPKGTLVLEVLPQDAMVRCPDNVFDFYMVLDPTFIEKESYFTFPRPLEEYVPSPRYAKSKIPIIGSFGFGTSGKGFNKVVEAVNKEFDNAVVRLNIPYGDFVKNAREAAINMGEECKALAKPGIEVIVTHDYMSKQELVNWCAENTLNCFLYERPRIPGLAATTDQAVLSGRPLAVSGDYTFRHLHQYLKPYPQCSLRESIEMSEDVVEKIANDWHPKKFALKFDEMLEQLDQAFCRAGMETFNDELKKEYSKSKQVSFSQAGEDLILRFYFSTIAKIDTPSYIDIGANHPYFISNTYLFYQKGSHGVCLEPNPRLHKLFKQARPRDICLDYGVAPEAGVAELYLYPPEYDGLSTFSKKEAMFWEERGKRYSSVIKVKAIPLDAIIDLFLKKVPDFVSMDIEGLELSILKDFDFKRYPIRCFCIETLRRKNNITYIDAEIVEFMLSKGYQHYAHTGINSIFIKDM